MSDSFVTPWTMEPMARLLCPCDSPGKNTGVGRHALLQGIFPNQGSILHPLLHCWGDLSSAPPGKPVNQPYINKINTFLKEAHVKSWVLSYFCFSPWFPLELMEHSWASLSHWDPSSRHPTSSLRENHSGQAEQSSSFPRPTSAPCSAPRSSLPAAFSCLHLQGPQADVGKKGFSPGWSRTKPSWGRGQRPLPGAFPPGWLWARRPGSAALPLWADPGLRWASPPNPLCTLDLTLLFWPLTPRSAQTSSVIKLFCPHLRSVLTAWTGRHHHTNTEGGGISCGQLSG